MDIPTIFDPYDATPDVTVLPSYFPLPGMGILAVNAFLLKAGEPVLVDTGLSALSDQFMENLTSVIDPADLRWLWLTHTDQDHIGSLHKVMAAAPALKVVTTFLGAGKMMLSNPLPMERTFFLNPGQSLPVGDRSLTALRPPTYDAPETTGFFDPKSSALFSADCFGALLKEPRESAAAVESGTLKEGLVTWATVDAPWMHTTEKKAFAASLDGIRELSPKYIFSSHLPAGRDMTDVLLKMLGEAPMAKPFVGPDQKALAEMAAGKKAGSVP